MDHNTRKASKENLAETMSLKQVPNEFPFPFTPYEIQLNFMKNVYYVLENSQFGIFESPTGTGKSLSLLCGILKWYYDHKQKQIHQIEREMEKLEIEKRETVSQDWIEQQSYELKIRNKIDACKDFLENLNNYEQQIDNIRKENEKQKNLLKKDQVVLHALSYKAQQQMNKESKNESIDKNDENLLKETLQETNEDFDKYMKQLQEDKEMLLDNVEEDTTSLEEIEESGDNSASTNSYKDMKIFFCSRTHSQLSQFVKEINKTMYKDKLRLTCLSSRQNYCINTDVNKLKNINLVNEKCMELATNARKSRTKEDTDGKTVKKRKCSTSRCSCPFKNETKIGQMRNEILSNVHDIEEVIAESKQIKACPYYSSRAAIAHAQLIVLPYNILLHKATRESCNINLKDSIVVIDEAHNLLDMIESIHSSMINGESIYHAYNQINNYKAKFLNKFNARNLLFLNQIIYLLKTFLIALNFKHLIEKKRVSVKDMKRTDATSQLTNNQKETSKQSAGQISKPPIVSKLSTIQNLRKSTGETSNLLSGQTSKPSTYVEIPKPLTDETSKPSTSVETSKLSTLSDFLMDNNIDNINIFKLLAFIHQSKLCYKLQNYSMTHQNCLQPPDANVHKPEHLRSSLSGLQTFLKTSLREKNRNDDEVDKNMTSSNGTGVTSDATVRNPMLGVVTFLEVLLNRNDDGRVLITTSNDLSKSSIKFLLLNPANHFTDIVQNARSVIVAGGTMEPVSEFKDQLFRSLGVPDSRIHHFSCGHVIPKENVLPVVLCTGPSNKRMILNFERRSSADMLNEVARCITNLVHIVPKGMVCFFPSYDYESLVYNYMKENAFIEQIAKKKVMFREPKRASDVDNVLTAYAKSVTGSADRGNTTSGGGVLFSVIGGKLSEGLNFSDDLGRCVLVVGMPYANCKSLYVAEKMRYLDAHVMCGAGRMYYRNSCMKGVNQSIGRAIRHANDYACMILLDARYGADETRSLLPGWIRENLCVCETFGQMFKNVREFFQRKKEQ